MIYLVGRDPDQYNQLVHALSVKNISHQHYSGILDVVRLLNEGPQAILIDIDGNEALSLEFCWIVNNNANQKKSPIILFSSNADKALEVSAFEAGVADFITKPFNTEVVLSRLHSRLHLPTENNVIRATVNGETILEINKEEYSVLFKDSLVNLSKKEFELLSLLAGNPGKVFSREQLFARIWSGNYDPKDRTIDVHIVRLRKKLTDSIIMTLKGIGYRFNARIQ